MCAMRRAMITPRLLDAGIAAVAVALAAFTVWSPGRLGTPVAGPLWLRLVFPVALGLPLYWRRSAPLAAASAVLGTMALHGALTRDSAEGVELLFAMFVAVYSIAAHSRRRRAWAGLAIVLCGYAAYTYNDRGVNTGDAADLWAAAFFGLTLTAWWLLGMYVRHRRAERRERDQARELEEQIRAAVEQERARLARELHDVISHNLSVVVVRCRPGTARRRRPVRRAAALH
jgi:signal transduction histidine kinase